MLIGLIDSIFQLAFFLGEEFFFSSKIHMKSVGDSIFGPDIHN